MDESLDLVTPVMTPPRENADDSKGDPSPRVLFSVDLKTKVQSQYRILKQKYNFQFDVNRIQDSRGRVTLYSLMTDEPRVILLK